MWNNMHIFLADEVLNNKKAGIVNVKIIILQLTT